jgi:hypothetical protein
MRPSLPRQLAAVAALAAAAVLVVNHYPADIPVVIVTFACCGALGGLIAPGAAGALGPLGAAIIAGLIDAGSDKPSIGLTPLLVVFVWIAMALPGIACALVAAIVRHALHTRPHA